MRPSIQQANGDIPLSELVVLGLLAERPRHGYDIEQQVAQRRFRDWTPLGRSLVYHVLGRLEARGWTTSRKKPGKRGPGAQESRLTPRGRRSLGKALETALSDRIRDPARTEVALMFGWLLGEKRLQELYRLRLARLERELERSRAARRAVRRWADAGSTAVAGSAAYEGIRESIFDHFEALLRAEIAWCRRMGAHAPAKARARPARDQGGPWPADAARWWAAAQAQRTGGDPKPQA